MDELLAELVREAEGRRGHPCADRRWLALRRPRAGGLRLRLSILRTPDVDEQKALQRDIGTLMEQHGVDTHRDWKPEQLP
jgi:hypothetical protein